MAENLASTQAENKGNTRFQTDFTKLEDDPIGQGTYGRVWKAKHNLDKKVYAVKEITHQEDFEKNVKEAENLSSLKHENIVRYFYSWQDERKLYVQMDPICIQVRNLHSPDGKGLNMSGSRSGPLGRSDHLWPNLWASLFNSCIESMPCCHIKAISISLTHERYD